MIMATDEFTKPNLRHNVPEVYITVLITSQKLTTLHISVGKKNHPVLEEKDIEAGREARWGPSSY